jgi:hypothetical protein
MGAPPHTTSLLLLRVLCALCGSILKTAASVAPLAVTALALVTAYAFAAGVGRQIQPSARGASGVGCSIAAGVLAYR